MSCQQHNWIYFKKEAVGFLNGDTRVCLNCLHKQEMWTSFPIDQWLDSNPKLTLEEKRHLALLTIEI